MHRGLSFDSKHITVHLKSSSVAASDDDHDLMDAIWHEALNYEVPSPWMMGIGWSERTNK
jgi:hypothetical protein